MKKRRDKALFEFFICGKQNCDARLKINSIIRHPKIFFDSNLQPTYEMRVKNSLKHFNSARDKMDHKR